MPKKVPHLITARRNGTGKISKAAVGGRGGWIISTLCLFLFFFSMPFSICIKPYGDSIHSELLSK